MLLAVCSSRPAPDSPLSCARCLLVQVLVGRGEADIDRAQFSHSFDVERRVCSEAQQAEQASASSQARNPAITQGLLMRPSASAHRAAGAACT